MINRRQEKSLLHRARVITQKPKALQTLPPAPVAEGAKAQKPVREVVYAYHKMVSDIVAMLQGLTASLATLQAYLDAVNAKRAQPQSAKKPANKAARKGV